MLAPVTQKSWKNSVLRVAQFIYIFAAGLVALQLSPIFLIFGLYALRAIFGHGVTIERSGWMCMAFLAYGSTIALVLAHIIHLVNGRRRVRLWSATLLHAFFCWATIALLTGDPKWFLHGDLYSKWAGMSITAAISVSLLLSVAALLLIASERQLSRQPPPKSPARR
jgi:hypothetical protein